MPSPPRCRRGPSLPPGSGDGRGRELHRCPTSAPKWLRPSGSGLVTIPQERVGLAVVLAGVLGAITWNMVTWWFGLPSSSSHALFGGLVGATLVGGYEVLWDGISKGRHPDDRLPSVGLVLGFGAMIAIMWIFRNGNPRKLNRGFRVAQSISAAGMSVGHGMQDAAKTMGIVVLACTSVVSKTTPVTFPNGFSCRRRRFWPRAPTPVVGASSKPSVVRSSTWGPLKVSRPKRSPAVSCTRTRWCSEPHLHDPHHHLGDHGCRYDERPGRGPLGRRRQHRSWPGFSPSPPPVQLPPVCTSSFVPSSDKKPSLNPPVGPVFGAHRPLHFNEASGTRQGSKAASCISFRVEAAGIVR